MNEPTHALSALALHNAYKSGVLDPRNVLEDVLTRIEEWEPRINAFYRVETEHARESARRSSERWRTKTAIGPLDGVPLSFKENIATAGTPLPMGTAAGAANPPAVADGPTVDLVEKAGGVRLGKTVMPDYAMLSSGVSSLHGITRSPLNPDWTVGGSSSGAGAAAAAGCGPLHVGSDIGGSIRLPCSFLGLVGLKPTYGIVPVDPPYSARCIGPLARSVDDIALAMSVLSGRDTRDYTQIPTQVSWLDVVRRGDQSVGGLRVAVSTDAGWGLETDPEIKSAVVAAANLFAAGGAELTDIGPIADPDMLDGVDLFMRVRTLRDIQRMSEKHRDGVHPFVREWAQDAAGRDGLEILDAYEQTMALRKTTVHTTQRFDLVLSPVSPVAAFPAHWPMPSKEPANAMHHIGYTAPYSYSEQPAVSINCGFTADRRPIGLQIAGRKFADVQVLEAAKWFESHRGADATVDWP